MYGIAMEYLSVVLVELAETYLSGLRFHGSDYGCGVHTCHYLEENAVRISEVRV